MSVKKFLQTFYGDFMMSSIIAGIRAPYSYNMVNLFSFGCHVIDRAYLRTYVHSYASTDCMGGVGETIKRNGGVFQTCLGKYTSSI